jgi:hypothetical protein
MRHPLIRDVLATPIVQEVLVPKLVAACFADILLRRHAAAVELRRAFADEVATCVRECDEPMGAFIRMRRANPTADGAVYDALVAYYSWFDRHVQALLTCRPVADRLKGYVTAPCIVSASFGEGTSVPYLAVPTVGLEPFALSVVAPIQNGLPRRAASGAVDWSTLPWHRIRAGADAGLDFDPEVSAGQAYAAGLLANPPAQLPNIARLRAASPPIDLEKIDSMSQFLDALLGDDEGEVVDPCDPLGTMSPSGPDDPGAASHFFGMASHVDSDASLKKDCIMKRFMDAMDRPQAAHPDATPPAAARAVVRPTPKTRRGARRQRQ